ncbi:NADH-quinone oxidoreductase subunit M [Aromatoleum toluvorans]|uniref:NADH-quinone oxidoreductase subunit M n=1 Tax=Aromatoleum toluvorans TaxID=92002 RepID=A0ABX1Q3J3_9RHOO|nr:NADH-quinone oxidoreductase subunit M [Aromatoleum toluvorans]
MGFPVLSLIVLVPLAGALLLLWLKDDLQIKRLALLVTTLDLALTLTLLAHFNPDTHLMQFSEKYQWIPALDIHYALGVDGISVLFVFLSAFLGWICVLASWRAIEQHVKGFMCALLVMQALMLGVFCAMDLFLFSIFWEAMLIPMYLIIGVWGGDNRIYAAFKFFLYTLAGSVLFLVGVIVLYFEGGQSFDIQILMTQKYPFAVQFWVFIAFFIAFAIKVPMFPFHTWLPDAHVQAPTAGSIVLAGVLLKMGAYGFLRFSLPMLPLATHYFATPVVLVSLVAIIYGGYLALAQDDLKKLVAYSSISHMGFVTVGLFALNVAGLKGGILQMFSHGIITGALFLLVGLVYERTHTRLISDYGGLMKVMPIYTTGLAFFTLAAMALPGTGAFIGELLVLVGVFGFSKIVAALAVIGALLSAGYLLSMFKRVALGKVTNQALTNSRDLDAREVVTLLSLALFVLWVGFYPMPFLNIMHASVEHLLQQTQAQVVLISR